MNAEAKKCAQCQTDFTIESGDFDFYKRLEVPPPTFCSSCREQRRYAWRNDRNLYRRSCDLCQKSTVAMYSPSKPFKVYCPTCWWGDGWDAADFAQDYNPDESFFEQLKKLQLTVPRIALLGKNSVNSEYTNHSSDNKNSFMCSSAVYCEDVMYSDFIMNSRDSVDCAMVYAKAERCYECSDIENCYQCQYCMLVRDSANCYYCYDCRGCNDCFLSTNLRNKKYCFLNKQYSKEEYRKKVEEFNLGSHSDRKKLFGQFQELLEREALHKYTVVEQSVDVTGGYIFNSKSLTHGFDVDSCENTKYLASTIEAKDSMDAYRTAYKMELVYECQALIRDYHIMFSNLSYDNSHVEYCDHCFNSQDLFGCIGIKKGSYIILNRQYSENEYKELRAKIISDMKKRGEYGEFFPVSLSPFAYNESHNYLYGEKLSKDRVLGKGWQWEDNLPGTFGKETVDSGSLPDNISDVEDSILKEALKCESCQRNYNIVAPELQFYRKESIPLPRQCYSCRDARRIQARTPRRLWHRRCACDYEVRSNTTKHAHHSEGRCPNEFETPYSPDRKEIIYCEACYNAEVV